MQVKKIAFGIATGAALLGSFVVPAFADGTQYTNNPGRIQATAVGAQCGTGAGSGAFQYFEGQPGLIPHVYIAEDRSLGTTLGAETGPANSSICGNPQN